MFLLSVSPQPTDCLRLTSVIDLLTRCEKRREEYGVVGRSEVRAAGAFVHDIQEKHPLFAVVVLVLFQIFTLL